MCANLIPLVLHRSEEDLLHRPVPFEAGGAGLVVRASMVKDGPQETVLLDLNAELYNSVNQLMLSSEHNEYGNRNA